MQLKHSLLCGLQFSCNDWDMDELSSAYLLEKLAWAERGAHLEGDDKQVRPDAASIHIYIYIYGDHQSMHLGNRRPL